MRAVSFSLFLLVFLVLFAAGNSMYVCGILSDMQSAVFRLPDTPEEKRAAAEIQMLADTWHRFVPYLSLVCGYAETNRLDEALLDLTSTVRSGDPAVYHSAKERLADALERLSALQRISLSSIF